MERFHINCTQEALRERLAHFEQEPVTGTFNECCYTIETKLRKRDFFRVRLSSALDTARGERPHAGCDEASYRNFAYFLGRFRADDAGVTVQGVYLSDVSNRVTGQWKAVAVLLAAIVLTVQTMWQRVVAVAIVLLVLAVILVGLEWNAEEYTRPHREILKQFIENHLLHP